MALLPQLMSTPALSISPAAAASDCVTTLLVPFLLVKTVPDISTFTIGYVLCFIFIFFCFVFDADFELLVSFSVGEFSWCASVDCLVCDRKIRSAVMIEVL
jgi:hypothetical protein